MSAGRGAAAIAAADVNGDGLLDLLVGNEIDGSLQPLFGDGRGSVGPGPRYPAGANPLDIAVGDFDRDGRLDCAIANHETSGVTVLLGDGSGAFAPAIGSPFFNGSRPHVHSVAAADLNGDGILDLVTESADTDTVQVLYGDGRARFSSPAPFFVGSLPYYRVRTGDLDTTADRTSRSRCSAKTPSRYSAATDAAASRRWPGRPSQPAAATRWPWRSGI